MKVSQDYHIHTFLSDCSRDAAQNPAAIAAFAESRGYDSICISDHCWDARVPGASDWYKPQTLEHVMENLPLPASERVRVYFGVETEYLGGERLGLSEEGFAKLDHVNIPLTHFHMEGFVRPASVQTPEQYARLLETRLEELLELALPFEKIGVAHISCAFLPKEQTLRMLEALDADRLGRAFAKLAKKGGAVELNPGCFPDGWQAEEIYLKPYRIAYGEGCRYYAGSDAHHPASLANADKLGAVMDALGLTEGERYTIRERVKR